MRWVIACAFLLAHVLLVALGVLRTPVSNGLDELAHISYVEEIAQHGLHNFDPAGMRMLPATLGDTFTASPNYLNHPPLYYLAMSWLLPTGQPLDTSDLRVLRSVNALMSVAMVGCLLALGLLRNLEPRLFVLFGATILLNPFVWSIGGIVSNDNAAFLGGALCLLGAQCILLRRSCGSALLSLGVLICAAAKLNAALLAALFAATFVALRWRSGDVRPKLVAIAIVLAALPYLWMTVSFGSPAPAIPGFNQRYQEIAQASGWADHARIGFLHYSAAFAANLLHHWSYQALATGPLGTAMLVVPVVGLSMAMYSFAARSDAMLTAAFVALLVVGAIHLGFSYRSHLLFGSPPFDAVPRYYLPLALGAVPLAVCLTLSDMPRGWRAAIAWALLFGTLAQAPASWLTAAV